MTLSKNLYIIHQNTFKDCTSLKKIDIPSSVNRISSNAFGGCHSLKEINMYSNTIEVDKQAFLDCENLERIIFHYDDCNFEFKFWFKFLKKCSFTLCDSSKFKKNLQIIFSQ